jgi:hypothetical protein
VTFDLDLGESRVIEELGAHFYQYNNAWIFPPKSMTVSFSEDGENYSQPTLIEYQGDLRSKEKSIVYLSAKEMHIEAQYLRFELESMGPLPSWHDAAGSDSWIFIDELIVR